MNKIKTKKFKSNDEIKIAIEKVSNKINKDYKKKQEILFVIVMKGGMFFASDLLKKIKWDLEIDYIFSKSYEKKEKLGKPKINYLETIDPKGKNIIIIDDLIDTGETLEAVIEILKEKNPQSIAIATIFDNSAWKYENIKRYSLFKNKKKAFLIGYGLDYEEKERNKPYISIVK